MSFKDVSSVFSGMKEQFDPSKAQGLEAVFQFIITGDDGGNWSVRVENGQCTVQEGTHSSPSVTLTMDAPTWLGIVNNQINGIQAFMSGKLKVSGDIMLAQRVPALFGS